MEKAKTWGAAAKTVDVTTGRVSTRRGRLKQRRHSAFIGYTAFLPRIESSRHCQLENRGDARALGKARSTCLSQTPFYAESGGQIADVGVMVIEDSNTEVHVLDVQKPPVGVISHRAR